MTQEELKKKIVEVIREFRDSKPIVPNDYGLQIISGSTDRELADALIAAGLKFDTIVSHTATFDLMQQEQINSLERRCAQAEHRAEVSERALRNAAPRLNCHGGLGKGFCRVDKCDYYHCNNDEGCVKAHLQQADKELAEEGKDGEKI